MPGEAVGVSESGIRTRADVERLGAEGVHAVLVGESFRDAADLAPPAPRLRRIGD